MFKFSSFKHRVEPIYRRGMEASSQRLASVHRVVTANGMSPNGAMAAPGGIRSPSTVRNQTGNPLLDNSLIDSWIPLDNMGLHQLMRRIYLRDPIAGPAVDFWRELPWSDYGLSNVEDPSQAKVFQDCLNALHINNWLGDLTGEFLVLGKLCVHFLWNSSKGYWDDLIIHNPDHIEVAKSPVINAPIKVDLKPTDEHLNFVNSTDPRDQIARKQLDPAVLRMLSANQPIPLDPRNTIYLPRRAFAYDVDGVSIFSRILYLVALERPLFTASILASRRRAGPVTQITAGNEEWEPSPEQLDQLATAWLEAEEDAVSAVFVTRNDVSVNRAVSSLQGDMWKISDEYQFLSEAKMKALGINDAFLSGDANFNTMETALSVFLERIRSFREFITNMVIREKIFKEIAKANDFVKRSQAEIDHKVRHGSAATIIKKANETGDDEELVIPSVEWHKHLRPTADQSQIELLNAAEEKGLPVPIRAWAAATGVELDAAMKQMDEDLDLRKKIAKYKQKQMELGGGGMGGEEGMGGEGGEGSGMPDVQPPEEGGGEATEAMLREANIQEFAHKLPIWDKSGRCIDLHHQELQNLLHEDGFRRLFARKQPWDKTRSLLRARGYSPRKTEIIGYVLYRAGMVGGYPIPMALMKALAERAASEGKENADLLREVEFLNMQSRASVAVRGSMIPLIEAKERMISDKNFLTGNQNGT